MAGNKMVGKCEQNGRGKLKMAEKIKMAGKNQNGG